MQNENNEVIKALEEEIKTLNEELKKYGKGNIVTFETYEKEFEVRLEEVSFFNNKLMLTLSLFKTILSLIVTLNLENANLRFLSSIVTSICAADFYKNVKNYFNLITIESFIYEVFLPLCDEYMANYYEKQKNANTLGR